MLYGRLSHTVQIHFNIHVVVLQPRLCRNITGLGFFPFARHYSGNHYCFLFLCLLRCFSSAGLRILYDRSSNGQVSPFGNPRIKSYLLIPVAYRSLSRPSSPLRAKASPVYPFLLSSTMPPFARHVCFFGGRFVSSFHFLWFNPDSASSSYSQPILLLFSLSITSSNMSKNFLLRVFLSSRRLDSWP